VQTCQPVNSHGTTTATIVGATRKNTALPAAATERRIAHLQAIGITDMPTSTLVLSVDGIVTRV
jgi:hypothetical protein